MRFQQPPRNNDDERILPLINVVFLLLIFFMLTGQLVASDPFEVEPPDSISGREGASRDLVVLVGADGRLALDGQAVAQADFAAALRNRLAATPEIRVRVKADADAVAVDVVAIMEQLRDAGVERTWLLTVPGAG